MLDEPVARRYGSIREIDKGARPYFVDNSNPPAYDYEIRSDGRLEEFHAGSDAPCEERGEWKLKEACGYRRAGDGFLELSTAREVEDREGADMGAL